MPLLGRVLLALGLDPRYVLQALLTLILAGLLVVLIVIQTVATVLAGGPAVMNGGAGSTATPGAPLVMPVPTAGPMNANLGTRIVELAQSWLGVPYVFGGCSRAGVDCSCLVQNVFAAVGIRLPRVAVDQFNSTAPVTEPQLGNLVFFANTYEPGISHVGIYIGGGLQINAPTTGQVVSVAPVFTGYWGSHYAGARRVHS